MVRAKKWGLDKKTQKWDILCEGFQDQSFALQGKSMLLEDTDQRVLSILLLDKDILRKQPTHAHSLFV